MVAIKMTKRWIDVLSENGRGKFLLFSIFPFYLWFYLLVWKTTYVSISRKIIVSLETIRKWNYVLFMMATKTYVFDHLDIEKRASRCFKHFISRLGVVKMPFFNNLITFLGNGY